MPLVYGGSVKDLISMLYVAVNSHCVPQSFAFGKLYSFFGREGVREGKSDKGREVVCGEFCRDQYQYICSAIQNSSIALLTVLF